MLLSVSIRHHNLSISEVYQTFGPDEDYSGQKILRKIYHNTITTTFCWLPI